MSEIFSNHYLSWAIFFLLIGSIIYTMFIVKKEKKFYQKHLLIYPLQNFQLSIPHWWTLKTDSNDYFKTFYRADTFYEWDAKFFTISNLNFKTSKEILEYYLNIKNIVPDVDQVISNKIENVLIHSNLNFSNYNLSRIETAGTMNQDKRIYLDLVILFNQNLKEILFLESFSSVLNGGIEGPYFEETLYHLNTI